jgi:hypothetical protein
MLFVQPILWQLLRQLFFALAFEIKIIKKEMSRERQNTIRVCERKLSQKLSKSGCTNIISHVTNILEILFKIYLFLS